tara:strand:- start:1440 stop:2246 length:807 start_codon:yes stop_codon:yes gene_type:complete
MGASNDYEKIQLNVSNPRNQSEVKTATRKAWTDLVNERGREHGYSYSGTFSMKDGVVISYFPQLSDEEVLALGQLVSDVGYDWNSKDLENYFIVVENKWIRPYIVQDNHNKEIYKRNPDYVKMAKKKTPIYMLFKSKLWSGNRKNLKKQLFEEKIPLPYNGINKKMESLISEMKIVHETTKNYEKVWKKVRELKRTPAWQMREEIQYNYPQLQGDKNEKGLIYRKAYKKADISIDNLIRMSKQYGDKHGDALAITNGSIVVFTGMCAS